MGFAATVALVVVLSVAAAGKTLGSDGPRHRLIALTEFAVAGALLLDTTRPLALLAAAGLAVAFLGYAVMDREEACRCFGEALPASSPRARLFRNVLFLALAATAGGLWLAGPLLYEATGAPITAMLIGLIGGMVVVAAPWAIWPAATTKRV